MIENRANVEAQSNELLSLPTSSKKHSKKFVWEDLPVEARIERASKRAHIEAKLHDMEPVLTDTAFDFYGTYVKINET